VITPTALTSCRLWARGSPWVGRSRRRGSAPLFFRGLDASSDRGGEQLTLQVASAGDDGSLAGVEDGAVRGGEGQLLELLVQGQQAADEGFLIRGDFDGNGRGHGDILV